MGRPSGTKSKNKKRNNLSEKEEKRLVQEYSSLSRGQILEKYNISKGQLLGIRRKFSLKEKSLAPLGIKGVKPEELTAGYYGIVRLDNTRAFVRYSDNIVEDIKKQIELLDRGEHENLELQKEWPFSYFISRVNPEGLELVDRYSLYS
jgi:hypothetical protein